MGKVVLFGAVAVVAEVGAAVRPEPESGAYYVASVVVLVVVLAAAALVPWPRLPGWTHTLVPLGFALWLGVLLASQSGGGPGLATLALLPLLWVALYGREWEAVVVLFAVVGALTVSSALRHDPATVVERRAVLWGLVGALLISSTYSLRRELLDAIDERDEALRQAQLLADASRELNSIRDPEAVVGVACVLAAEIVSTPYSAARRANFIRVEGDLVHVTAQYDQSAATPTWPLSEHPLLQRAVRSGKPTSGPLVAEQLGPVVAAAMRSAGVTDGAWVPVVIAGELYGVLGLDSRGDPISPEDLSRCVALAQLVELSLENALAHQRSERAAITDPLTGVANRRGLERAANDRRGRRSFAALMIDVDDLKGVNDRLGHGAGDELLLLVAAALGDVLRDGDVLARVGGDEFAALIFDTDEPSVCAVAERMIASVDAARTAKLNPRISIGIAGAGPDGILEVVLRQADAALYEAKQRGGMRFVLGG